MSKGIKTPWYDYYDGIRQHLDYPDILVYELLEKVEYNVLIKEEEKNNKKSTK